MSVSASVSPLTLTRHLADTQLVRTLTGPAQHHEAYGLVLLGIRRYFQGFCRRPEYKLRIHSHEAMFYCGMCIYKVAGDFGSSPKNNTMVLFSPLCLQKGQGARFGEQPCQMEQKDGYIGMNTN